MNTNTSPDLSDHSLPNITTDVDASLMSLASGIYQGTVRHRRYTPKYHDFTYQVFMVYLDLHEMDAVFSQTRLWSKDGWSLAWFRRKDFLGGQQAQVNTAGAQQSLYEAVADTVEESLGNRPEGPIRMLTNLRYFGFIINPITCYYCFDSSGEKLQAIVAEVTNTPWGESCQYVLDFFDQTENNNHHATFDKTMPVSPFQPMDLYYTWKGKKPGKDIVIHLDVFKQLSVQGKSADAVFDATLVLHRQEITANNMRRAILRYPLMTLKVCAAIYWQAMRLWCKGIPFIGRS